MHDLMTSNIWSPSFPDLKPLDYYVWALLNGRKINIPHKTLDSVIAAITRVMTHMDEDRLIRACKLFRQRIESVIATEGDFIE